MSKTALFRVKVTSEGFFGRGVPLLSRLATFSEYIVLPGAMIAALVYCPDNDPNKRKGNRTFST